MLSLNNYFFPVLNVQANPHFNPKKGAVGNKSAVDIKGAFSVSEDSRSCSAVLDISVHASDEVTQVPYEIEITAVGSFSIPEGAEAADFEQRAPLFAFSILYTSSREMILTLTSRGPWEKLMLPIHHFHTGDLSEDTTAGLSTGKRISTKSRAKQK